MSHHYYSHQLFSFLPSVYLYKDTSNNRTTYRWTIGDLDKRHFNIQIGTGRWSDGCSVGMRVGGEDNEVGIHLRLARFGNLYVHLTNVSKRDESEMLEFGVSQCEDAVMVNWFRKGGWNSSATVVIYPLDILFGCTKVTTVEDKKVEWIMELPHGSYPVETTMSTMTITRRRLPLWKSVFKRADVEFGDDGVLCPSKSDSTDRRYSHSFTCDSVVTANMRVTKSMTEAWNTFANTIEN